MSEKEEKMSFEDIKSDNKELYEKLTNKNKDYIFQVNTQLEDINYDLEKKERALNKVLNEMILGQKESTPAKKMFGTPTELVQTILDKKLKGSESEQEPSPMWQLYADGALFLGGIFSLITGYGALRSSTGDQVGLLQVIVNFILGGFAMLVLTKYAPTRGEPKGMIRYILATFFVMVTWIAVIVMVLLAFDGLNPVVPAEVVIGIGLVALSAKWYLKKKLNITGTLF